MFNGLKQPLITGSYKPFSVTATQLEYRAQRGAHLPTLLLSSAMSWLVSLFTGNKQNSRRGQAMNTTHEAFSLPTSSPVHTSHPDAFNPDTLQTPDPDSAGRSFTYPPVSPVGAYGFGPYVFSICVLAKSLIALFLALDHVHNKDLFFLSTILHSIPRQPHLYPLTHRYSTHGTD